MVKKGGKGGGGGGVHTTSFVTPAILEMKKEGKFYLTTQSTHFIYGYIASDILWLRTTQIVGEETRYRNMGTIQQKG